MMLLWLLLLFCDGCIRENCICHKILYICADDDPSTTRLRTVFALSKEDHPQ